MARVNAYLPEEVWNEMKKVQGVLIRKKLRLYIPDKHGNRISRPASSDSSYMTRAVELLNDVFMGEPEDVIETIRALRPDIKL